MEQLGMLIDFNWCTGCHSCEVACQMEHNLPPSQSGIVVHRVGPWEISADDWQYDYTPTLSKQCTMCTSRIAVGKKASCEQHCQAQCIKVGPLKDLAHDLGNEPGSRKALFVV